MNLLENKEEKIAEILEHFDFKKVAENLEKLGWVWIFCGESFHPTELNLKERASYLLDVVADSGSEYNSFSTGGLEAVRWGQMLKLSCVIEHWKSPLE